jgi:hypothetical protein
VVVGKSGTSESHIARDLGTGQADLAGGGEPFVAEHATTDRELISGKGGAFQVDEVGTSEAQLPRDVGAEKADLAGGAEPVPAHQVPIDDEAVGNEGEAIGID